MRRLLLLLLALLPLAAPASAAAPDFALLDHHGRAVTAQDFAGRPMLVYFGYTFCPDFCPTSLAAIGRALELLDETETARVAPLFVTLDPERDTPAVLAPYVGAFHPKMIGLTGAPDAIAAMAKAYRVKWEKAPLGDGYAINHATSIFLVAPGGGMIRLPHGTPPETLAAKLREMMR
ncbi:MAG: SCO family protein [Alphaproteobacteria bacterium]|nr:SCO family protein [Alphaproteobacteria bacterium]